MKTRFPWKIFSRFILTQILILICALLLTGVGIRFFFEKQFVSQTTTQLHDVLVGLSQDLPRPFADTQWCQKHVMGTALRLTVISQDGVVLCDSHSNPKLMENHSDRPEVGEAKKNGFGFSVRKSHTLNVSLIYAAIYLEDRSVVLRAATPISFLTSSLKLYDISLAAIILLIVLVFGGITVWFGRRLMNPLGQILSKTRDVSNTDIGPHGPYGEWADLETYIEGIRRDLAVKTEKLDMEREELSTMMASISDAIIAVDLEEIPLFYNARFALLFGSEDWQKKSDIRLSEIFKNPEILGRFKKALSEGRTQSPDAIEIILDKNKRYFSLSVSPLSKPGERPYGAVGIFHDVTDLKTAERVRIDFVANVSHELRTPLTSIKGYTDTIIDDIKSARAVEKEYLEAIGRNVNRLLNLMNDLLDLSSLESRDNIQKDEVLVQEISEHAIRGLNQKIKEKGHTVEIQAKITTVQADRSRLEQVLVNILDNAIKYTPENGKILINWVKDGKWVALKVTDNGPGIPHEHHARLFERFYRVDKARSREQGGTGLGLAIVKHIMQGHGGTVAVESELGKGSTFICRFPFHD